MNNSAIVQLMSLRREKALELRLKGYSYNEIHTKLAVPKSTLSNWFSNLLLPEIAQKRIKQRVHEKSLQGILKRNAIQTHRAFQQAAKIRKVEKARIGKLSKKELLLLGAALYWAEGYKKPIVRNGKERSYHKISFSNSDPVMVKVFIKFLNESLQIPKGKIKASVRIFEHINEKEALGYWQKSTGLPAENFQKFYYGISKSSMGKRPFNRLPYGTIQIIVGDTKNFHRMMGWIEGIKQHFD